MPVNMENTAVDIRLENVDFCCNPKEKQSQRISNYHAITLISHASKVMLKILQARHQQYMNHELPDVQAGFRKGREPEIKLPSSIGHRKSKRGPEKYLLY